MKCQHCGINFSDEDHECPICGARAGSRGRVGELEKKAAAWREKQFADEPTYQKTRAHPQKARASTKPIRETPKGKGKVAAVVAVAVVLLNVLPAVMPLVEKFFDNLGSSLSSVEIALDDWDSPEPDVEAWDSYEDNTVYYTPGGTYEYDPDNYVSIYATLYDLTGGRAVAGLSDGSSVELLSQTDNMDVYSLIIEDSTGQYAESGYAWCTYNYPEDGWYDDAYPPERYDSLALCLTMEQSSYDGSLFERYDMRQENSDLWLLLYVDRETHEITLQDIDGTGFFGGQTFVSLQCIQEG